MSLRKTSLLLGLLLAIAPAWAQIGQRFPSEKRVVNDPVTGTPLSFLTTLPRGDSKIYPSHPQWTADGQWLVFRSARVKGEAIAVHEATGDMVQVTEGGYDGMLNLAQSGGNKLFFLRKDPGGAAKVMQAIEVDLDRVFADSRAGSMKPASSYQRHRQGLRRQQAAARYQDRAALRPARHGRRPACHRQDQRADGRDPACRLGALPDRPHPEQQLEPGRAGVQLGDRRQVAPADVDGAR
jgi:hypothetical protein